MLQANFERSLRRFTKRKPFRPFRVDLTSGTQFVVEHPEALAYYNGKGTRPSKKNTHD